MRKWISLLLVLMLCLSLCACAEQGQTAGGSDTGADLHEGHTHEQEEDEPPIEEENVPKEDADKVASAITDEPAIPMPAKRPEDFAVYFEWGVMDGNFLDTFEGKVGRDMVSDEDITADYTVSEAQLDEIYTALLQYKIAHIRTEMTFENLSSDGGMSVSPKSEYLIRFRVNGKEHIVRGDVTASFTDAGKDYEAFNSTMADLITKIWRELEIPEPKSAYC